MHELQLHKPSGFVVVYPWDSPECMLVSDFWVLGYHFQEYGVDAGSCCYQVDVDPDSSVDFGTVVGFGLCCLGCEDVDNQVQCVQSRHNSNM